MTPTLCLEQVETLWSQAETLFYELKAALADINEMWAEITSMFRAVLPEEGHPPEMVADYSVESVQQHEYMKRATALLSILSDINDRNNGKQFMAKVNALKEAFATMDQEYAARVFEPETARAFLGFYKTITDYPCDLKKLQATAIMVAYTPMFYIQDAFAAYLSRPRSSTAVFKLLLKIAADAAVDSLGPVVSIAKSIAEAAHEHSEGRYESFKAGLKHEVLKHRLKTAVEEGLGALHEAEQQIAQLRAEEERLDRRFDHAVERCTQVMKFLSKER